MSTKTRIELVNKALAVLLVVGSGQTAAAEDFVTMDNMVQPVIEDLAERSVFTVSDDEAIEAAAFEWLAICLAQAGATDFGKEQNPQQRLFAEQQLKTIAAALPTYATLETEHF